MDLLFLLAGLFRFFFDVELRGLEADRRLRIAIPDFSAGLGVVTQPTHTMTGIIAQETDEVDQGSIHYRALFMLGMVLFCSHAVTQVVQQQQQQQDNAANYNNINPQERIHEIVNLVSKLPMEEFVPQEQMAGCKVSQLQQMLRIRSRVGSDQTTTTPPLSALVEKNDLVAAVTALRNYNDTCCICYEEYQAGDPLRVLPHCRHEFHVECLDQWAYTFERKAESPSCPLCRAPTASSM